MAAVAEGVLYEDPIVRVAQRSASTLPESFACGGDTGTEAWLHVVLLRSGLLTIEPDGATPGGELTLDPTRALVTRGRMLRVSARSGTAARCLVVSVRPDALDDRGPTQPGALPIAPRLLLAYHRFRCRSLWQPVASFDGASRPLTMDVLALIRRTLLESVAAPGQPANGGGTASIAQGRLAHRIREILAASPGAPHTLAALAKQVGTSPFHLAHVFRSVTGISVHRHLVQLRLATALERLAEGEDSLSALALDLGFSTHSHFTAVFRRNVGMTPKQARAALVGGHTALRAPGPRVSRSTRPRLRARGLHAWAADALSLGA
jgi:AraC-like DNA-binding protein